jgi:hypothetical protein
MDQKKAIQFCSELEFIAPRSKLRVSTTAILDAGDRVDEIGGGRGSAGLSFGRTLRP